MTFNELKTFTKCKYATDLKAYLFDKGITVHDSDLSAWKHKGIPLHYQALIHRDVSTKLKIGEVTSD